jgi:predicted signal transduction protein with EAL and GGDEF domain
MQAPIELEWLLRAFGIFWIVAGAATLYQARQAAFMDQVLNALQARVEDPLVTRFLYVGGGLTLASGAALAVASAWSPLVVGFLVLSQIVYFALKRQRWLRATTADARAEATVATSTRNAFVVSVAVWSLSLWAFGPGYLWQAG